MIAGNVKLNNDFNQGYNTLLLSAFFSIVIQLIFWFILLGFTYNGGSFHGGKYVYSEVEFNTQVFDIVPNKSVSVPFYTLDPVGFGGFHDLKKSFVDCADAACFNALDYANVKAIETQHCTVASGQFCTCWTAARTAFTPPLDAQLDYTGAYDAANVKNHFDALEGCIYSDTLWVQNFAGFKIPVKMLQYWFSLSSIVLLLGVSSNKNSNIGVFSYVCWILAGAIFVATLVMNSFLFSVDTRNSDGGPWSMLMEIFTMSTYIVMLISSLYDFMKKSDIPFIAQAIAKYNIIFGFPAFHYIALIYIFHYNDAKNLFLIWFFYLGVAVLLVQLAQFRYTRGYKPLGDYSKGSEFLANKSFTVSGNVVILALYFIVASTFNVMQYNSENFGIVLVLLPIVTLFVEFAAGWLNFDNGRYFVLYFS